MHDDFFPDGPPRLWSRFDWLRTCARVAWLITRAMAGSKSARERVHVLRRELRARARAAGMQVRWTTTLDDELTFTEESKR